MENLFEKACNYALEKHSGQHRILKAKRRDRGHAGRLAAAELPAGSEPAHGLHRDRNRAHPLRVPLLPALFRAGPDRRQCKRIKNIAQNESEIHFERLVRFVE